MRRKSTATFIARQPAAEGPDVIYNGSDFDIYVDARYLGSRVNSQDAWIEARRVHFANVEAAAIETADITAAIAETTGSLADSVSGETFPYTQVAVGLFAVRVYADGEIVLDVDGIGTQLPAAALDDLAALLGHPTVARLRQRAAAGAPVVRGQR